MPSGPYDRSHKTAALYPPIGVSDFQVPKCTCPQDPRSLESRRAFHVLALLAKPWSMRPPLV
jgi:hypothetical protein